MAIVDHTYGRIPVEFPDQPHASGNVFAAYIAAFLPADAAARVKRKENLTKQLRWWRLMTDIPVHVVASNWTPKELSEDAELQQLQGHGGSVLSVPPQALILNRIACLKTFYSSDYPWGIIMDDDAILHDSPRHNSGGAFFSEMANNDAADYTDVDVFFPINPAKLPGQNQIWQKTPRLYSSRHVFDANYDLKGSMFVVRNFRLHGRREVLPSANFSSHGEDTLFAIEAVSQGCSVFRCGNIVLKELKGPSHFQHTREAMKTGNQAIAEMYAGLGLKMNETAGRQHLLDRSSFLENCLGDRKTRVTVTKP